MASLTSLRAFAALAVFTRHAGEVLFDVGHGGAFTRQGATAVSFFFVLSGFVLTWSYRGDVLGFYRRRVARIVPSYVLMLVVTTAVVGVGAGFDVGAFLWNLSFLQSWVPDADVYFSSGMGAWSLGCELFFYLLFPALLPALASLTGRRRWALAAGVVVAQVALALIVRSPEQSAGTGLWLLYVLPITRLGEFVLGVLAALAVRDGFRSPVGVRAALLLAGAAYVVAGFVPVHLMWVVVTVVPFTLLIATVAGTDRAGHVTFLHRPWLRMAGDWTYAFYLVHISVLTVVHRVTGVTGGPGAWAATALAFVLSAGVAAALFSWWERPMEAVLVAGQHRRVRAPWYSFRRGTQGAGGTG